MKIKILGVILLLFILFMTFGNRNQESLAPSQELPIPTSERHSQQKFIQSIDVMYNALSESEMAEQHNLVVKAVNLLPHSEKEILVGLQKKFADDGYKAVSDDELIRMRQLNNKAVSLLPEPYKERLMYLLGKVAKVSGR